MTDIPSGPSPWSDLGEVKNRINLNIKLKDETYHLLELITNSLAVSKPIHIDGF